MVDTIKKNIGSEDRKLMATEICWIWIEKKDTEKKIQIKKS